MEPSHPQYLTQAKTLTKPTRLTNLFLLQLPHKTLHPAHKLLKIQDIPTNMHPIFGRIIEPEPSENNPKKQTVY